jgi:ADP-ribosylglycohydrolase
MIAFLEAEDVEQAIRLAVSLGGDSDTQASIAGGLAEACFGPLPATLEAEVRRRLPGDLLAGAATFTARFRGPP